MVRSKESLFLKTVVIIIFPCEEAIWNSILSSLFPSTTFPFLLSGGPLLLMELAFLLRSVGAEVYWITLTKPSETYEVLYSLEHKMLDRGVQVVSSLDHYNLVIYPFMVLLLYIMV